MPAWAAAHVVAEEDEGALWVRLHQTEESRQGMSVTVDIADGNGAGGAERFQLLKRAVPRVSPRTSTSSVKTAQARHW